MISKTELAQLWDESPGFRLSIALTVCMLLIIVLCLFIKYDEWKQERRRVKATKRQAEQMITEMKINNDQMLTQLDGFLKSRILSSIQECVTHSEREYLIYKTEMEIKSMIAKLGQNNKYADNVKRLSLI